MIATGLARTALIALTRFVVGGHARWIGTVPSTRQRIYFANHGSHLDTIVLWAALPPQLRRTTHPVAAADYWGRTRTRRHVALDILNCVLIDRKRTEPGADPLAPLHAKLVEGGSLVLFPEGTRGTEALPGPFKRGLHSLAVAFPDVELVPVYLDNLSRAFPKGAYLPAPISCSVRFGTPIQLGAFEDQAAFLARARDAVASLAAPAAP